MKTLRVQEYLKKKSLNDLEIEHGVGHRLQDHKVLLNYNQIEARDGDALAEECRGLILRKKLPEEDGCYGCLTKNSRDFVVDPSAPIGETKVLAAPFFRFYNYGQSCAAKINWDTARIYDKVDGSLIIFYYDDVKKTWCIATRNVPEANIELTGFDFTFSDLFMKALDLQGTSVEKLSRQGDIIGYKTYMFELCSPYNRIVVNYEETRLFLLGVRNNLTLKEERVENSSLAKIFPPPRLYDLGSVEDIVQFVNEQDPTDQEGVVIVDGAFNRLKVKSLSYVSFNKARDKLGASYRNCLALVLEEQVDDLMGKLPKEIEDIILDIKEKLHDHIMKHEEIYLEAKEFARDEFCPSELDMKKFADFVSRKASQDKEINSGILFGVARNKVPSIYEAFTQKQKGKNKYSNSHLDSILSSIGYGKK